MSAFSMYYIAGYSAISDSFNSSQKPSAAANSAAAFIYIYGAGYVCDKGNTRKERGREKKKKSAR